MPLARGMSCSWSWPKFCSTVSSASNVFFYFLEQLWFRMVALDSLWFIFVPYGSLWLLMVPFGFLGIFRVTYDSFAFHIVI